MREAGTILDGTQAERLADFLLTLGIRTRIDQRDGSAVLWVYDEDRLQQTRNELQQFLADPNNLRYKQAIAQAEALKREEAEQVERAQRNMIEVSQRWQGVQGRRPLTVFLIAVSIFVGVLTEFGQDRESVLRHLTLVDYTVPFRVVGEPLALRDISRGDVWRAITPAFIHWTALHLLFNMYWLYVLGGAVETRQGSWYFALMFVPLAAIPIVAEGLITGHVMVGGMSGVGYGLFGYVWIKSRYDPASGYHTAPDTVFLFIMWFVICLTGFVGNVANWAHGIGFAIGVAWAIASVIWRRRR